MSTPYPPAGDPQGTPPQQQYPQQQYPQQQYPQQQYPQQYGAPGGYPQPPAPGRSNGMAITALVLGIIALLLAWIPIVNFFAIVLGIVALILGFLGMKKSAEVGGRGLAIGGIITGGLALLGSLLMIVVISAMLNSASDDIDDWNNELEELNQQIEEDLQQLEEDAG